MSDTEPRFLRACRGEAVDRPPLWMMRQAGRYLPEYWEVRNAAGSFMNLCRTPDMCVEVTLQPIRRFQFDASIVFSDILIPAEAMGAEVSFVTGKGPQIANPVRNAADVQALRSPEPREACPYVFETIRSLCGELGETPLIGFVAAPFTLFCYLVEGGGSKNFVEAKRMLLGNPELAEALLTKIVDYSAKHALAEVEAGCRAFQIFDTWAELLTPPDYEHWALRFANQLLQRIRAGVPASVPLLYFSKGSAGQLALLSKVAADVISIDWRLDIERARAALGGKPIQGNLDPLALVAGPEVTRQRTQRILDAAGGRRHIMNLGHGILPMTPIASVEALCETVWSWGAGETDRIDRPNLSQP